VDPLLQIHYAFGISASGSQPPQESIPIDKAAPIDSL
jgi:hypothetical protein